MCTSTKNFFKDLFNLQAAADCPIAKSNCSASEQATGKPADGKYVNYSLNLFLKFVY